jgi:uncharacterized protein (DUF2267 family)
VARGVHFAERAERDMEPIQRQELVNRVLARSGARDGDPPESESALGELADRDRPGDEGVERIVRATLVVISERLTADECAALRGALCPSLAGALRDAIYDTDFDGAELYERVRRRADSSMSAGVARERVQVVLQALGELLDLEHRDRLARALPSGVREHLAPRKFGEPPPHELPRRAPPLSTLATGRPGSRHPLSESAPDQAHAESVVLADNPHADTKLSSAGGLTQERFRESLSTARRAGPAHPISEATDGPVREQGDRE